MALLPVSSRRALVDLSDDVATRVQSLFYLDAADALRKALNETCARLLPGSFLAKALPIPPQPLTGQIYSSGGIFNRLSYDPSLPMMLL